MSVQPDSEGRPVVRQITPNSIPEISRITGKTEKELWKEYKDAVKQRTSAWILLSNPFNSYGKQLEIAAAYAMGKCFYQKREAGDYVCVIHNQRSRHPVDETSRHPCLGLENGQ